MTKLKNYEHTSALLDKLSACTNGFLFCYVEDSNDRRYFEFLGPQFEDIYGIPRGEALQNADPVWACVHPSDVAAFKQTLEPCKHQQLDIEFEFRVLNTQNKMTHLLLKASAEPDHSGGFNLYGYCNNVNPLIETHEQLLKAQQQLERALATQTRLLATVSHELRTPVAATISSLQLVKDEALSVTQSTWIDQSLQQLTCHLETLEQIMDITALVTHEQQVPPEWTCIDGLLHQVVEPMHCHLRSKQLRLHLNNQVPADTTLKLARLPISQIVTHLLDNAIKFTHSGCIEVSTDIGQDNGQDNEGNRVELCLSVIDTGIGLPQEEIERILEPLYQADSQLNRWVGGTGLGLTLVKTLVDALEGTLSITSTVGQGTQVTCCIPTEISSLQSACDAAQLNQMTSSELAGSVAGSRSNRLELLTNAKILVAEDNELNRAIMGAMLARHGCTVAFAFNGEEAVMMARNAQPDAIIMDLQMPVLDGFEATRQIREMQPKVPIIAWSASRFPEQQQMAKDAGMNDYLTKPTTDDDLKACLASCLSKVV